MVAPNLAALLPFIDASSILNRASRMDLPASSNEPIDLSKSLKRSRDASADEPLDFSVVHKRHELASQHSSHVFGEEKRVKKEEVNYFEQSIREDEDDDEEDDEDVDNHLLALHKKKLKVLEDHRPLTPVSSSSSPQTISSLEKKAFLTANDATIIRSRDRYSCTYCAKTFPRSANLTRHLRTHTDKYLLLSLSRSRDDWKRCVPPIDE